MNNDLFRYDPRFNIWMRIASMNDKRAGFTVSVVDNRLYALGGVNAAGRLSSMECYSLEDDRWRYVASVQTVSFEIIWYFTITYGPYYRIILLFFKLNFRVFAIMPSLFMVTSSMFLVDSRKDDSPISCLHTHHATIHGTRELQWMCPVDGTLWLPSER